MLKTHKTYASRQQMAIAGWSFPEDPELVPCRFCSTPVMWVKSPHGKTGHGTFCCSRQPRIAAAGGVLAVVGDRIQYQLPEDRAPLVELLRELKPALVELLQRRAGRAADHQEQQAPPGEMASIPALPPGVKLVNWNPKLGPVVITRSSVVNDVPRFIRYTLEQLTAALDGQSRSWHARAWSPRDLVERVEQVGVLVEFELNNKEP